MSLWKVVFVGKNIHAFKYSSICIVVNKHEIYWTTQSCLNNRITDHEYTSWKILYLFPVLESVSINDPIFDLVLAIQYCSNEFLNEVIVLQRYKKPFYVLGFWRSQWELSWLYLRRIGIEPFSVLKPLKYTCNKCVTLVYWWMTTILKSHYKKHFICVSMQCSGPEHQRCLIRISDIYTAYRVIPV